MIVVRVLLSGLACWKLPLLDWDRMPIMGGRKGKGGHDKDARLQDGADL